MTPVRACLNTQRWEIHGDMIYQDMLCAESWTSGVLLSARSTFTLDAQGMYLERPDRVPEEAVRQLHRGVIDRIEREALAGLLGGDW